MEFQSVSQIKDAGFSGFVTVESLFNFGYASIPEEGGVYMILRKSVSKPVYKLNFVYFLHIKDTKYLTH